MKRQQDSHWSLVRNLVAAAVLIALAIGIYSGNYDHPFAFDDANSITENPEVQIQELTPTSVWKAGTTARGDGRRPLSFASLAVNFYYGNESGQLDPSGFHLVNNVIHAINGVLVFFFALLTFRLLGQSNSAEKGKSKPDLSFYMAFFAAALFVAHPIQSQAVTYIVQRMTSMATMFYLLALTLYIVGRQQSTGWLQTTCWGGAVLSVGLSWSSKQLALPLLFVIPLYEWYFFQGLSTDWLKRREFKIGIVVALLLAAGLGIYAMSQTGEDFSLNPLNRLTKGYAQRDFTMAERLYTQPRVVMLYLQLVAVPLPSSMNLLHEIDTSTSLFSPITSLLSLLGIAAAIGAAIWFARRQPLLSFAVLWFFVHLVIESTVLPLEMVYEHRIYLPFVGVALAVSYLVWQLFARQQLWGAIISCVLVAVLSAGTVERNKDWADIYQDVLSKNPNSLRALLGRGLKSLKQFEETRPEATREYLQQAADDFARVIEIKPSALDSKPGETKIFDTEVLDAYVANAEARGILGDTDEAVLAQYAKVEAIDPSYKKIYISRGNFHFRNQRFGAAIEEYTKAINQQRANLKKRDGEDAKLDAGAADLFFRRGLCYLQQQHAQDAMVEFDHALKLMPHYAEAQFYRAVCFRLMQNPEAAIEAINKLLQQYPEYRQAKYERAMAMSDQGRYREAGKELKDLVQKHTRFTDAILALIRLYATAPDPLARNPDVAMRFATSGARQTNYKDHRWLNALALAQSSKGQFMEALVNLEKAMAIAPAAVLERYRNDRLMIEATQRANPQ